MSKSPWKTYQYQRYKINFLKLIKIINLKDNHDLPEQQLFEQSVFVHYCSVLLNKLDIKYKKKKIRNLDRVSIHTIICASCA